MYHTPLQENFYLSTTNSFPQGRLIFYFVVQAWDGHYFTWRVQKIMLIIKDNAFKTNYKKYHRILLFVLSSFWCPVTIPCHTDVSVYKSMLFHENGQNFMWHYLRLGRQHFLHDEFFCSCRQTLPESQAISGVCLLVYKDCSLRTMTNKLFGNK